MTERLHDPIRDSALHASASAEVDYPWEVAELRPPGARLTVIFAGEPLSVTESQLEAIRRLVDRSA